MDPLLEINDLYVYYKSYEGILKVLNGIHINIYKGEKIGVIGEAGSGKTTTMKSILRTLPINALVPKGEIIFKGRDILKMDEKELQDIRRHNISMIFQDPTSALNPVFTVGEQLIDIMRYANVYPDVSEDELKVRIIELLKEVALPDPERVFNSYPFQLSGGMRQRIVIAMAVATAKDLLIADEPTTNLDVTIKAQILKLIKALVERKDLSVILVSQELGAVRETVDRVYVMYAGEVIETAETSELYSNPLHPYTRGLLGAVPRLTGGGIPEGVEGRIPNYINPPNGCRFHPRCKYAKDVCRRKKPPSINVCSNHEVACWLYYRR